MVAAAARLRSSLDFTAATRRGRRGSSATVVVHLLVTDRPGGARAGFVVSKKVGNSVVRHRVTRRLRPLVRAHLPALPDGTDLVVRALPDAAQATSAQLSDHLDRALRAAARRAGIGLTTAMLFPTVALAAVPRARPPRVRRTSPLAWLLIQPIRAYQRFVTPYTPPSCRYYPTCSAYAVGALRAHGAVKGVLLTAWRLLRCNPWSTGGIDHVPARGRWRGSTEIMATATEIMATERLGGANRSASDLDSNAQPDPARAPIAGSSAA